MLRRRSKPPAALATASERQRHRRGRCARGARRRQKYALRRTRCAWAVRRTCERAERWHETRQRRRRSTHPGSSMKRPAPAFHHTPRPLRLTIVKRFAAAAAAASPLATRAAFGLPARSTSLAGQQQTPPIWPLSGGANSSQLDCARVCSSVEPTAANYCSTDSSRTKSMSIRKCNHNPLPLACTDEAAAAPHDKVFGGRMAQAARRLLLVL